MRMYPVVACLALLAGCATNPAEREREQLALHREHAGAPVPSFRYYGRMTSWTSLGDQALAVWTSPSRAYLLHVDAPCNDLAFAQAIRLSESTGMVHARFDNVTPIASGMRSLPCRIREIRPIDVDGLREARRRADAGR